MSRPAASDREHTKAGAVAPRNGWRRLARVAMVALALAVAGLVGPARAIDVRVHDYVLHMAWSEQPPYQYLDSAGYTARPSGLDIAITSAIAEESGIGLAAEFIPFGDSLEELALGQVDMVPGAYSSAARQRYAWISAPYRTERDRLFVADHVAMPQGATPAEVVRNALDAGVVIAAADDFDWGETLTPILEAGAREGTVLFVPTFRHSIAAVQNGRADAFLGDEIAGLALSAALGDAVTRFHPVILQQRDIHVLFSRASVPAEVAEQFDAGLARMKASGRLDRLVRHFIGPLNVELALDGGWFELLILIGMVAFSISGVVIARTGGYSIYGAVVLASLPALGGGVVRDLLMLREIYLFTNPEFLVMCLAAIALGYLFNRVLDTVHGRAVWYFDIVHLAVRLRRRISPNLLLQVFDALGLAAFTVIAVSIAAEEALEPLWLWGPIMAAVTATGGAILRDMIRKDAVNPMLHSLFYGEAALIWSLGLSLYLQFHGSQSGPAAVGAAIAVTMAGLFVTRMAFVAFDIRSPRY